MHLSPEEIKQRLIRLNNLEGMYVRQVEKNRLLEIENKELRTKVALLEARCAEQEDKIAKLELMVEQLQAMIFKKKKKSKEPEDEIVPNKTSIKNSRTTQSYRRPTPNESQVTETNHYQAHLCSCGGSASHQKDIIRYIEDMILPSNDSFVLKKVSKEVIEVGICDVCGKQVFGKEISSQHCTLGPGVKSFVVYGVTVLRLSYDQVKNFLQTMTDIKLSDGEIVHILQKESIRLTPEYQAMQERIRLSPGVHYDETTRPVQSGGEQRYARVMVGVDGIERTYTLGQTRGGGNLIHLKGSSTAVGISDDYGVYRNAFKHHQLCRAHPIRKMRDLSQCKKLTEGQRKQCILSLEGLKSIHKNILNIIASQGERFGNINSSEELYLQFDKVVTVNKGEPEKLQQIKESLRKNKSSYFTCIHHQGIPTTNNVAERSLRSLVIKRKLSFGSKTKQGTDMMEKIYSVVFSLLAKSHSGFFDRYLAI